MKSLLCLLPLLLLGAAPAMAKPDPAGTYRLVGEQDVASGLRLQRGGRFQYFLIAGALDEAAEGRWSAEARVVTLTTEPKPVPPAFEAGPSAKTAAAALTVKVSSPGGGIAGVDLRIGFDEGPPIEEHTQEDGWSLPEGEKRIPRWIELKVPMHDIVAPRFPIDLAAGNALAFTFVPNDLGKLDFTGIRVEAAKGALIVHRGGARLRYEAVRE
jgi:hypothetical protein